MFAAGSVDSLAFAKEKEINTVIELRDALRKRFYQMDDAVDCLMLAAMSGEAMVMIGKPGTAKSRLVRAFSGLIGLIDEDEPEEEERETDATGRLTKAQANSEYFEYLLTQFTEPGELFGYYDFSKLKGQGLVRDQTNMMNMAKVVFLDEVFNASSAILNALLTFMNERKFHDGANVWNSNLQLLVSASNRPPQEQELDAVYDRFLLRCPVYNVAPEPIEVSEMLSAAWTETYDGDHDAAHPDQFVGFLDKMEKLRSDIKMRTSQGQLSIDTGSQVFGRLADITLTLRRHELSQMTNRRLVKFAMITLCAKLIAIVEGKSTSPEIVDDDLDVFLKFGLNLHEENDMDAASLIEKLRAQNQ
ncbi:MAG: AAA family ATPase [Nisaea sp.]|uniref:AAA family ATPase n=1 Tax=Nisaea sp. TaxID=2024842 RepID=UPI0032667B5D